ncbi:MAG: class I SAM-dependent methyltransferase [Clostridium butyricum]|nr:class I SAM-dependent methyltransferase [Clostridium butyricum]
MFWDKAPGLYDIFKNLYNGEVNRRLVIAVSNMIESYERVLECACGTGMISKGICSRCKEFIATDFSDGMLRQVEKNCAHMDNVEVRKANIMKLDYKAGTFDNVVAGNVIHLLDEPYEALAVKLDVFLFKIKI